jgi:probable F420-dependent oxidoreductase
MAPSVTNRQIRFSVQAGMMSSQNEWRDLAMKVEDLGFYALYVADHLGLTPSPFSALTAAADATSTLRLGTYVVNSAIRDPLSLASDAATLDVVSGGRLILGLGAGHTSAEWTMTGSPYPSPAQRVGRFAEMVHVVTSLLRGDVVTYHGRYLHLDDAFLLAPRPVQSKIPLLIGGNGTQLLRDAGRAADIVSLTGLGRTLEDGHRHTADWSPAAIDVRVGIVREVAPQPEHVVLDALVQHVEITDHRVEAAERHALTAPGLTTSDVLDAPYALIGTLDQIVEELTNHRERWGFTSYVVRADALDLAARLVERTRSQ